MEQKINLLSRKHFVAETLSGDYNFHRLTCKPSEDYFLNNNKPYSGSVLHQKGHKQRGMGHVVFYVVVDCGRKFHGNGLVFL